MNRPVKGLGDSDLGWQTEMPRWWPWTLDGVALRSNGTSLCGRNVRTIALNRLKWDSMTYVYIRDYHWSFLEENLMWLRSFSKADHLQQVPLYFLRGIQGVFWWSWKVFFLQVYLQIHFSLHRLTKSCFLWNFKCIFNYI